MISGLKKQGAAVQAVAVIRQFPETGLVVDRVSLSVQGGEIVALLGPSGCGKSTFLRLIAGLDDPNSGMIQVSQSEGAQSKGFVFQDAHLVPWRSVLDNVALPLELLGTRRAEARERARSQLARVGLGDAVERFPNQLSGGMKMRVSLARALITEPSLLLLDEPFSALDENTRHTLQDEVRRIWETRPLTLIFVTHSVSEAVYLANRAVVFSKRPARILYDAAIDLPSPRHPSLRTDPAFLREMKRIYEAVPIQESPL